MAAVATIAATGGFDPRPTPTPQPTPTPTSTALPSTGEVFPASFQAVITVGDRVHKLGFELFNGSTETITVWRVEFSNPDGGIEYLISEEDIANTWGSGDVASGDSFTGSIAFDTPPALGEVEQWQARWDCRRADGQDFVVPGTYGAF